MKSKSAALIELFHQLLDARDPEKIQDLLDRIHRLNSQLTFEQRMRVYNTVLQETRERAVQDIAAQEPDAVSKAILEELDAMKGKAFMLVPVTKERTEMLQDHLQKCMKELNSTKDPQQVHEVIRAAVKELENLPDRNLCSLGYYILRENLELRVLSTFTDQEEIASSTLFCALYLADPPALALSLLRYSVDRGYYWLAGSRELIEAETLVDLKRELQAYRDIICYATAPEAAKYAAQIRSDIADNLLRWISQTDEAHSPEIDDCVASLLRIFWKMPNLADKPVPTYRVANVLYSTMCLGTEEDRETYRAAVDDQGRLIDACPCLYGPLRDFTLFALALRLYQALENTWAVMPPVVECLFRLYLALSLSDSAPADDKICSWILEVSE